MLNETVYVRSDEGEARSRAHRTVHSVAGAGSEAVKPPLPSSACPGIRSANGQCMAMHRRSD